MRAARRSDTDSLPILTFTAHSSLFLSFFATSHAILTALIGVIEGVRAVESSKTVAHRGTRIYAHSRTCNGCRDAPRARLRTRFLRPSAGQKMAVAAGPTGRKHDHSTAGPGGPTVVPAVGAVHPLSGVK